jgi:hypothetical protein
MIQVVAFENVHCVMISVEQNILTDLTDEAV